MAILCFSNSMSNMFRVGFSKDIHKLVEGRKLLLCGVNVPSNFGEEAHSDGDVCYHAIAEAIYGALGSKDLGSHFPDNLEETKDMDSALIMKDAYNEMKEAGYSIGNIDIFISLEKPKLKDYIDEMKNNVANLLKTDIKNVSIKAGTNEGFGSVGEGKAIEAYAIVLLNK